MHFGLSTPGTARQAQTRVHSNRAQSDRPLLGRCLKGGRLMAFLERNAGTPLTLGGQSADLWVSLEVHTGHTEGQVAAR